jgi:hypothetical protein
VTDKKRLTGLLDDLKNGLSFRPWNAGLEIAVVIKTELPCPQSDESLQSHHHVLCCSQVDVVGVARPQVVKRSRALVVPGLGDFCADAEDLQAIRGRRGTPQRRPTPTKSPVNLSSGCADIFKRRRPPVAAISAMC